MFQSVKFLFSFTWGVTHYQTQCQYYETCAAGQNTSLRNEINIVCTPDPHSARGQGVEPPTKFSKRVCLT